MQRIPSTQSRRIFLAFDAFGTLFTPRRPVAVQYGEIARKHGISGFTDAELQDAFKQGSNGNLQCDIAFRDEARRHPNYGKEVGMKAPEWWANIITRTFQPFLRQDQSLPEQVIPELLTRFSTREGYSLFPDVLPFFNALRTSKLSRQRTQGQSVLPWPWDTSVGVITNSDDRIPGILQSFGLGVGARRAGSAEEQVAQMTRESHDIDFVVLSYDVGYEKPDRRIFEAAEEMFVQAKQEIDPEAKGRDYELWYVGDDGEKDVKGAKSAGWKPVHILRGDGAQVHMVQDSAVTIRDLNELRNAIEATQ